MSRLGLGAAEQFFGEQALRRARLIKITPKGVATPVHITTSANAVVFEGETYQTALAIDLSAQSESSSDAAYDTEIQGVIDSDLLTNADLNNGVYRGAQVDEYIVDPKYPYAGALRSYRYYIQEIEWDGEVFRATCGGIQDSVAQNKGENFSRQCVVPLFSTFCGVSRSSFRIPTTGGQTVTSVDATNRRVFTAQGFNSQVPTTSSNDYLIFGTVEFLTGKNAGRFGTIVQYLANADTLSLAEGMPFDIQVGDTFAAFPGCQKTVSHCRDKFDNLPRFQGNPYVRTASSAVDAPTGRT